jgi:K+-sensing histidine kinase KdpD
MARFPRSLLFYIAASSVYAALVYIAVHATYGFELGRAGVRLPDPEALIGSIDAVSFIVWLGISLIAGTVLYHLAMALQGAQDQGDQRRQEIASIFAIGQSLAGSLELEDVAQRFLETSKRSLDTSVTASLYIQDDSATGFRLALEQGPDAGKLWAAHYRASEVPGPIRTRVVDHQQPLVIPDVTASQAWTALAAELTQSAWVRSFAALPLVSHDRLVGIAAFASGRTGAITADGLQLVALVAQFVASSVRTSLSFREAERRADREAIVSRVAQKARAALEPDQVLAATVEELGRALDVKRVVAATGPHRTSRRSASGAATFPRAVRRQEPAARCRSPTA